MVNSAGDGSGQSGISGIRSKQWYVYYSLPSDSMISFTCRYLAAGLNPQVDAPTPADANIVFPDVSDWAKYCDSIPRRRRADLGTLSDKFTQEGFFEINQLTKDRISLSELAQSLGIGFGIAGLIVRYVEEDIAQIRAGTFTMDPV